MTIMYVDDSGSASNTDQTNYFVLSGIIVRDDKIKDLQRAVFEYRHANFVDGFIDSEIHTHDIYKSTGSFKGINAVKKIQLLDDLYRMIGDIECVGISIVIDKSMMPKATQYEILDAAWQLLVERYNYFLKDECLSDGRICVDEVSNKIRDYITEIFHKLVVKGGTFQRINRLDAELKFANSAAVAGIQIADTFAYCTLQHIMYPNGRFAKYWNNVYSKLRSKNSKIKGYGYKEYQTRCQDVQPRTPH